MSTPSAPALALPVVDEALARRLSARLEVVEEMLIGHTHARTAYVSMSATPVVLELTDAVAGRVWDAADWSAAARQAAAALDPEADVHATAAYRLSLAEALTRSALAEAVFDLEAVQYGESTRG